MQGKLKEIYEEVDALANRLYALAKEMKSEDVELAARCLNTATYHLDDAFFKIEKQGGYNETAR